MLRFELAENRDLCHGGALLMGCIAGSVRQSYEGGLGFGAGSTSVRLILSHLRIPAAGKRLFLAVTIQDTARHIRVDLLLPLGELTPV